ncbi:hypothetical protein LMIY3S_02833 [Labrys miyagiensis]
MSAIWISLASFLAIFCSALAGVAVAQRLPQPHLSSETRTAVSVSMAVVGTMAALVLSLMITSASNSFKVRSDAIDSLAINIVKLDRALLRYGTGTGSIRSALKAYADAKVAELSIPGRSAHDDIEMLRELEGIEDQISSIAPATERERLIASQAMSILQAISDARWLLVEKTGIAIPASFLVLLIFWLALLFASFGLFAPKNATVIIVLLLCALAISGGVFMILELGSPTSGLIRVSIEPLRAAAAEVGAGH